MNDSFIDDETEEDKDVSRKKSKNKYRDVTSSFENESAKNANSDDDLTISLTQHRAVLEKQKKTQGYNTDNIGEDSAIKDELNRNEQVTSNIILKDEFKQKQVLNQDTTMPVEINNPTYPLETNDDEGEEINPVETFIVYKPKKSKIGRAHPDVVVETVKL